MRRPLLIAALSFAACRGSAYRAASRQDTIPAYRTFLREHPSDEETEVARARLAELELAAASQRHTVVAYKRFLEEFGDTAQASAAKSRLETLRFNAATAESTSQAWRRFLHEHPAGGHREEAERLLAEAEQVELATADPETLARTAKRPLEDPLGASSRRRLDGQVFLAAKGGGSALLYAYLHDFPSGAHREAAQVELLSRKLEGLFASGLLEEARSEAARSPLSAQVPELPARMALAEAARAAASTAEPLARAAQATHYVRPLEDLLQALRAPDPLDRWQAAEELGQHVSVRAIDPLLEAAVTARNLKVRRHALESLENVLRGLPPRVADHELASRLEAARTREGAELSLSTALLEDLHRGADKAGAAYARVFDPGVPDPLVLWRWARLRRDSGRLFSSAVAARQLASWARAVAEEPATDGPATLGRARSLCAAEAAATFVVRLLEGLEKVPTEFPQDVEAFTLQAQDTARLTAARLRDAELTLRTEQPGARVCADAAVSERLAEGESRRLEALRSLARRLPAVAPAILRLAAERDPSPAVRAEVAALRAPQRR